MNRPVLIQAPESFPVTLEEAKAHLRVDWDDEDGIISAFIAAAVSYLDGWSGILGRCLVEQTWRMDFSKFCRELPLPLAPVTSIASITWRNADGQTATIDDDEYLLEVDSAGNSFARFRNAYVFPSSLYERDAISVTFVAGYPADEDDNSTVPGALKVAILLLVAEWFNNREASVPGSVAELPFAVNALISPFRRMVL
ncbi:head-tail connector protein [Devosia riboflavina]|uniref:head-tail connector protein n=1 Tax=Devosia riboflavina TaxID=46914 RepID=UPI00068EB8A3|nr:head-tail connector protein [Devosia riboflavina]